MECEACGSSNVSRRRVEGHLLFECNLCGELQGDDAAVAQIKELKAGRARGLDDHVIPLVSALEGTGAFHVVQASGGDATIRESPYVFFTLSRNDTSFLEKLLRSVELANRATRVRWLIELTLQHGIVCVMRPRFWKPPGEITADEIDAARQDLATLAKGLRRDASLAWWRD